MTGNHFEKMPKRKSRKFCSYCHNPIIDGKKCKCQRGRKRR